MKKVKLQLEGLDGNAFSLMGAFKHQARKEGWSSSEIDAVLAEAQSGDYDHLLCTLSDHCADPEEEEEEDEEEDDDCDFADPGGRSALRAATEANPRNLPCPSCGAEDVLTPADVARGY